jgi:hypothetical protein
MPKIVRARPPHDDGEERKIRKLAGARHAPGDSEPGQGERRQGEVGVPGRPGADLVVVQPGLALGLLEAFLDAPAAAGDPGQAAVLQRRGP